MDTDSILRKLELDGYGWRWKSRSSSQGWEQYSALEASVLGQLSRNSRDLVPNAFWIVSSRKTLKVSLLISVRLGTKV